MILKFKNFINEVRLEDDFKLIGDNDLFKKYKDRNFNNDENLVQHIIINNDKISDKIININWNQNNTHDIYKRIKERTNFKSTSEFNTWIDEILNNLFSDYFNDIKKFYKKYNLYSIEKNISIITIIKYDNLFENDTKIIITTIINGKNTDVDKIIELDI